MTYKFLFIKEQIENINKLLDKSLNSHFVFDHDGYFSRVDNKEILVLKDFLNYLKMEMYEFYPLIEIKREEIDEEALKMASEQIKSSGWIAIPNKNEWNIVQEDWSI